MDSIEWSDLQIKKKLLKIMEHSSDIDFPTIANHLDISPSEFEKALDKGTLSLLDFLKTCSFLQKSTLLFIPEYPYIKNNLYPIAAPIENSPAEAPFKTQIDLLIEQNQKKDKLIARLKRENEDLRRKLED